MRLKTRTRSRKLPASRHSGGTTTRNPAEESSGTHPAPDWIIRAAIGAGSKCSCPGAVWPTRIGGLTEASSIASG